VATANRKEGTISVLINTTVAGATAASFGAQTKISVTSSPYNLDGLALGDINGDGRPDLVAQDYSNNRASVFLNTTPTGATSAAFASPQTFATGVGPYAVAFVDIDGDGRLDLVVGDSAGLDVAVFLNETPVGATAPSFAARQTFGTSSGSIANSLTAADLNGDGQLDLAIGNGSANDLVVLVNRTVPPPRRAAAARNSGLAHKPGTASFGISGVGWSGSDPALLMGCHLVSSVTDLASPIAALDAIFGELPEPGNRKADSFFGMGQEPVRRDTSEAQLDPSLGPDESWESLGDGPSQAFRS
jgi:hypothetical protein